jgi:putative flippase GtrA
MLTRLIFTIASGKNLRDTQTGLRGIPKCLMPWLLSLSGERFEYEINMLLNAGEAKIDFVQMDIETVYIDGNKSTHFRAIRDSVLVMLPIFRYLLSGIFCAIIDYSLLFVIQGLSGSLLMGVVGARIISSAANFAINHSIVFKTYGDRSKNYLFHYYTLAAFLLVLNYLMIRYFFVVLGLNIVNSKVLTEVLIYILSFLGQRFYVFKSKQNKMSF